jgi:hypothetical protein
MRIRARFFPGMVNVVQKHISLSQDARKSNWHAHACRPRGLGSR